VKDKRGYAINHQPGSTTFLEVIAGQTGRWRVSNLETTSGDTAPPASVAKAMADPIASVNWLLSNESAKTAIATFPRLGRKELPRALAGWVAREEGGKPNDWSLSWKSLAETGGGSSATHQDVFLLYTNRETVDDELGRAGEWSIRPRCMLPSFMILDQFYRRFGPEASDLGVWNLVFLGRKENFLCISTKESLLLTRPLPMDLSEGSDHEEYLGRLATEVDRSVSFSRQTENSPEVEKIIVCGDPELVGDLVAIMDKKLATPAIAWDLKSLFEGEEIPDDPDLALLLAAAALSTENSPYNLGPKEGRKLMGPRARRRSLIAAVAVAGALVPILLIGGLATTRIQDTYLHRARSRVAESAEKAKLAEDSYLSQRILLAQEVRMHRFTGKNPDLQSVLLKIAAITPKQVVYEDLQVRELPDGRFFLHLQGAATAKSAEQAQQAFLNLLHSLENCDFLAGGGEPRQLEITGFQQQEIDLKSTVFSMEYQLLPPVLHGEG
jgi:hypothetical protein